MKKVVIIAVSDPVSKRLVSMACEPELIDEAFDRLSWKFAEELVNSEMRETIFVEFPDEKGVSFGDMKMLINERRKSFEYSYSDEEDYSHSIDD